MRVAVIGGGVCGYSSALRILEHFRHLARPLDVTVISELFSPHTTGDGSAGFWGPFMLGGTPMAKIYKWSKDMHDFLEQLWLSEDAAEAGVCLVPVISLTKDSTDPDIFWKDIVYGFTPLTQRQLDAYNVNRKEKFTKWSKGMHDLLEQLWLSGDAGEAGICLIPTVRLTTSNALNDFWKDIVYGCAPLTQQQLDELNVGRQKKFTSGLHFVTYTSEPIKLLPYLMKRFAAQGGKTVQQKVENLDQFIQTSPYDVIINCTGLGSRELLKDEKMYAVRGQVSRVKANWMYCVLLDESDDGNYIIPNVDSVVLGGTHQEGDYNTTVSPKDKQFIVNGCRQLVPGLAHAQHLFDWVGLRPGREQLRLEAVQGGNKIVIHNYGHGGSGVTLAWGCAEDVLKLLEAELKHRNLPRSKL